MPKGIITFLPTRYAEKESAGGERRRLTGVSFYIAMGVCVSD